MSRGDKNGFYSLKVHSAAMDELHALRDKILTRGVAALPAGVAPREPSEIPGGTISLSFALQVAVRMANMGLGE